MGLWQGWCWQSCPGFLSCGSVHPHSFGLWGCVVPSCTLADPCAACLAPSCPAWVGCTSPVEVLVHTSAEDEDVASATLLGTL